MPSPMGFRPPQKVPGWPRAFPPSRRVSARSTTTRIEKGVFLLVLSYPLFLLASLLPPMFGLPLFWPDLWIIVFLGAALIAFAAADAFARARRFNRGHASRP